MMENIRVAPSTMLKELSFNPMANPLEKDIREQDEKILSELFGSATLDNSDSASDLNSWAVIADDSETWFVTLWSALEDLFDYECIVAFGDNIGAVASLPMDTGPNADEEDWSGEEENDEAADDQPYLAGNVISGLQAVKRMLLRGVQSAESSLFAKRKLSTTEMNKYVECKSRLIAKASLDRSHHYSLSSTQWNVLGLILVYSILTRADIIAESTSQTPWRQLVNVVMLTLMTNCNTGTAKDAHNPLDDNELNILLNFFHIIDN